MAGNNKQIDLWPELTQNVIRSSHGHSTPSLKISCKSVQLFSRNVADNETKKSHKNNTEVIMPGMSEPQYIMPEIEHYLYLHVIYYYIILIH